jgi:hypothetical protein
MSIAEETCRPRSAASVAVRVSDRRGRTIHSKCSINHAPATARDYLVLRPGQEVASTAELDCFHLGKGESIRVEASYWDPTDAPPPAPAGARHLGDRLDARAVIFTAP